MKKSKNCNNCGDINCAAHGDGEQFSCKNWVDKDTGFTDWMHDDITWCRRKCPNKECFRNQVNRRLKVGLISVSDMYKEGECPKEAKIEAKLRASLQGKQKRDSRVDSGYTSKGRSAR